MLLGSSLPFLSCFTGFRGRKNCKPYNQTSLQVLQENPAQNNRAEIMLLKMNGILRVY